MRLSATITPETLKGFFTKHRKNDGSNPLTNYNISQDGDILDITSGAFALVFEPRDPIFNVQVKANEDESDSDSKVTDDPVAFLVEFMGGSEYFEKMASDPDVFVGIVRKMSSVAPKSSKGMMVGRIRRMIASLTLADKSSFGEPDPFRGDDNLEGDTDTIKKVPQTDPDAKPSTSDRGDVELKEVAKLKADMKEKGWKVHVEEDDRDLPVLNVDIGGQFTAQISVDHIQWHYAFRVNGNGEFDEEGATDDPIRSFNKWANRHSVDAAIKGVSEVSEGDKNSKKPRSDQKETEAPVSPYNPTVRAPSSAPGKTQHPSRPPTVHPSGKPTARPPPGDTQRSPQRKP